MHITRVFFFERGIWIDFETDLAFKGLKKTSIWKVFKHLICSAFKQFSCSYFSFLTQKYTPDRHFMSLEGISKPLRSSRGVGEAPGRCCNFISPISPNVGKLHVIESDSYYFFTTADHRYTHHDGWGWYLILTCKRAIYIFGQRLPVYLIMERLQDI